MARQAAALYVSALLGNILWEYGQFPSSNVCDCSKEKATSDSKYPAFVCLNKQKYVAGTKVACVSSCQHIAIITQLSADSLAREGSHALVKVPLPVLHHFLCCFTRNEAGSRVICGRLPR